METIRLAVANRKLRYEWVEIEITDSGVPMIQLTREDRRVEIYRGPDLFECLKEARKSLEEQGLLLCCQGARPMVFPSGMGRQMSNGRLAYPLRRDPPLTDLDLVDIFAPAPYSEVGTIEDQRRAVMSFFRST